TKLPTSSASPVMVSTCPAATSSGFSRPSSRGLHFGVSKTGNWSSQDTYSRFMADADGDGKPDIVGFAQSGVYVSINTSTLISSSFAAPKFVPDSSFWGVQTGGWSSQNLYPHFMADKRRRQSRYRGLRPKRRLRVDQHFKPHKRELCRPRVSAG